MIESIEIMMEMHLKASQRPQHVDAAAAVPIHRGEDLPQLGLEPN